MDKQLKLFPRIEPFNTGYLSCSEHNIYYEECGNANGKPVVFLHGGPGGGGSEDVRRFFDPAYYRIIVFDQRGCGRSTPHGCLTNNTTWDLVSDIDKLRQELGIAKWMVFGGSWGSTLALAYSQSHPSSVSEIVIRGIFMLQQHELDWFYQEGASKLFPDEWQKFIDVIEDSKRGNLMKAYNEIFNGSDEKAKLSAAVAWSRWEASTSKLVKNDSLMDEFSNPHFALAFALIENHYFMNKGFLEHEKQLLDGIEKIRNIPAVIVQGRYDVVCPMETAYEISKRWPEASFEIAQNSGHSAFEKEIVHLLVSATNKFAHN
ncbi:MAG: prolyl aminopeptidase [Gammaproteobacteria bacterium]|nr:prolyl aminopeptidase [Gammaproteobacteria bacterium]MDG1247955.1 prolyl aminopeptidase [SAR86 cluster bacterium]MDG2092501.1 prolyl aminopeptidase [SAR86 cluster bacterium]|tara:strand:- start:1127 stop:2080 length:954 start_codon:yes stop_codon:yes gene_type:complete